MHSLHFQDKSKTGGWHLITLDALSLEAAPSETLIWPTLHSAFSVCLLKCAHMATWDAWRRCCLSLVSKYKNERSSVLSSKRKPFGWLHICTSILQLTNQSNPNKVKSKQILLNSYWQHRFTCLHGESWHLPVWKHSHQACSITASIISSIDGLTN